MRSLPRPSWQGTTAAGVAALLVLTALTVQGSKSAKLDLNESGVWITSDRGPQAGRVDTEIAQVDATLSRSAPTVDVLQDGRDIMLVDPGKSLEVVDPASASTGKAIRLALGPRDSGSGGSGVVMGGSTVGIVDGKGRVWLQPFASIDAFKVGKDGSAPLADLGPDGRVEVGATGRAFGLSPRDKVIMDLNGSSSVPLQISGRDLQFAVVGDVPVVLSPSTGLLQVGGGAPRKVGVGAQLQQSSGASDSVAVTTARALVRVPIGGGPAKPVFTRGTRYPVNPVSVDGCVYGAWKGGGGLEAIECGDGQVQYSKAPLNLDAASTVRFRVNRSHVLLNDLNTGLAVEKTSANHFTQIKDLMKDKTEKQGADGGPTTTDNGTAKTCPKANNFAPHGEPDIVNARPGVATILNVLVNDTDLNCDLLTITRVTSAPNASVEIVDTGGALQFTGPPGVYSFEYTISDGALDAASLVTVTVGQPAKNEAPHPLIEEGRHVQVLVGKTVSYNVLADFADANGDAITLVDARLESGSGTVRFQADGVVTYIDDGAGVVPRQTVVNLTVSDGQADNATGTGKITFDVSADAKPLVRDDRAEGLTGQPITVNVLGNDTDPSGGDLRLSGVDVPVGSSLSARVDSARGLVIAQSEKPGTYNFDYTVTVGSETAAAHVTVIVRSPSRTNAPPIAVRDVILVPLGGAAVVDVIANDIDPDNDVLVVQSVAAAGNTGLSATVLEHRAVRVEAQRTATGPIPVSYTLSDGVNQPVVGQLSVFVTPEVSPNRAPLAKDDVAVVRAGDVVSVPVTENDTDPDGDALTVDPRVQVNLAPGAAAPGTAFVQGATVRFVAGKVPGATTITYTVSDPAGERSSALVRVTILPTDARNQPPLPRSIEARVFAGGAVDVVVPVVGVDPDGDSIGFRLDLPPTKGRVVRTADSAVCQCFHYEAFADSRGTDSFTYLATDPGGLSASATIRVGISERPGVNQNPVVGDDTVQIRPGRTVAVAVLANDTDPEGDAISLDPNLTLRRVRGVVPRVENGHIVVSAGGAPDTVNIPYSIVDGHGGRGSGSLSVEVTPSAPLMPPIARDDVADVPSGSPTTSDVAVLRNDEDPDGTTAELTIKVVSGIAAVAGDHVRVSLGDVARVVAYSITDRDGLSSVAVIRVPSRSGNRPPRLIPGKETLDVEAGSKSVDVALSDHVEDPEGRPVTLTSADRVIGTHGSAKPASGTAITFTPDAGYVGPASITFEVSDRSDPADVTAAKATLSLAVNVKGVVPPVFRGTRIEVAADGVGVSANLYDMTTYSGARSDLTFHTDRIPPGLQLKVGGGDLTITADRSLAKQVGTTIPILLTVEYGLGRRVPGFVEVAIVSSRRPLPRAVTDVADAQSGKPITVNVLNNDAGENLTVVDALPAPGIGSVSHTATTVTITPDSNFRGTADIAYSITDNPNDAQRIVTGTVRLVVKDKPDRPSAPRVAQFGNGFVVLTWVPGSANGASIDEYEVSAPGVQQNCGTATTCRIVGLTNGTPYVFTVRAHNGVDWSAASDPSVPVTPDVLPDPPAAPSLTYQPGPGGELHVSWSSPVNQGSKLLGYEIQLSGLAAKPASPTQTTYTWTGLDNHQTYTAQVRAQNSAQGNNGWSDWSPSSAPESPAGIPAPPTSVTAAFPNPPSPIGQQIQVSWTASDANAVSLTGYIIEQTKGGVRTEIPASVPVGDANLTQTLTVENAAAYSFRIFAVNKAGRSDPSVSSGTVTPYGIPATVGSVTAMAPGADGSVDLTFSDPDANGNAITSYEVTVKGGGGGKQSGLTRTNGNGPVRVGGLLNGTSYAFTVTACNAAGCSSAESPSSGAAVPYGPPGAPSLGGGAVGATTVNLTWNAPASNGAPVAMHVNIDGGGFTDQPNSGTASRSGGYSQVHTIQAYATSGATTGPTATFQVAANPAPAPFVNLAWGIGRSVSGCTSSCQNMWITGFGNFPPNGVFSVRCEVNYADGVGWRTDFGWIPPNVTSDGAGNGSGRNDTSNCVGSPVGSWQYRVLVNGTVYSNVIG